MSRRLATSHKIGLGLLTFFVAVLVTTQIFLHQTSVGSARFIPGTMLLMGLTVLVVVLVLILGFILSRSIVKTYFERRSNLLGSRFKIRLLVAFGALSLAPALLQLFLAGGLISRSIDQWFSAPAKQILENSAVLADRYYQEIESAARGFARSLAPELAPYLSHADLSPAQDLQILGRIASRRLAEYPDGRLRIYDRSGRLVHYIADFQSPADRIAKALAEALQSRENARADTRALIHDVLLCSVPIHGQDGTLVGALLLERLIPQSVAFKAYSVHEAYDKYAQLEARRFEYRWTYFLVLTLASLMILSGFSWFALYVAKRITVPIQELAEGAEQVASGNLQYRVRCESSDEVQNLVDSFNRMIEELELNRRQIETTHGELQRTHAESEERRRYIETLLENVPSCVITTDAAFRITTVNRAATEVLRLDRAAAFGQDLGAVMDEDLTENLRDLARRAEFSGQAVREIEWVREGSRLHLAASLNFLSDAEGRTTGAVFLLEDLTELINAEKLAAWREVARRLAHEIRNPLTPIQLSAERIRRRVGLTGGRSSRFLAEGRDADAAASIQAVIDEGTQLIIQEARSLKRLVEEFSRFARMPVYRPTEVDINQVVDSTLLLYEERWKDVRVRKLLGSGLPLLRLDSERMKRALINLVDNAQAAMARVEGEKTLTISTRLAEKHHCVRIEVADTGMGFSEGDRDSLFLPYFSRRRKGTGLGLAIVRQIVDEHGGRIRAEDNVPRGARMIIDLPLADAAAANPAAEAVGAR